MKKVLVPYQREEFIKYCDKHDRRECDGNLWLTFGYGSKHDMSEVSIDLCDECADKLLEYLKKEFGEAAKLKESNLL
jgi:hypothetical protein